MSMIKIEHLRKEYPNVTPLKDVTTEIQKGDVISVIGPSGTGKSTLLRCLNQLEEPTSGTVTIDGEVITDPKCDISKIRRKMGMVFQSFNLFNNLNIIDNVTVAPVKLLKIPKEQAYREGMELLRRVGLSEKAESFPDELSGGQKQRVAIARAIAMKPEILLFDEPTSALDPTMVGEVLSVIRSLARDGMTMMIVTHEMNFARDVSTRVFYMDEGGIYEEGTPAQIFGDPQKEKTRIFIKRLRQLRFDITTREYDFVGATTSIEAFGRKNMLSPRTIRNMQLCFEEIIVQNLLAASPDARFPICTLFEHSEAEHSAVLTISYAGERYDPFTQGDALSARIVRSISTSVSYSYDTQNSIRIEFRSDSP